MTKKSQNTCQLPTKIQQLQTPLNDIFSKIFETAWQIYGALQQQTDDAKFGSKNASGEEQLALDVLADTIIFSSLSKLPFLHSLCSEERENAELISPNGSFSVAYDPLDGSSLVGTNLSIGSIFGIYAASGADNGFRADSIVASAYVVYGVQLGIAITTKELKEVWYFVSNGNSEMQFQKKLSLSNSGKINATGGTQKDWSDTHKMAIWELFKKGYRLRYSGGMVPDLHHILAKGGGIFSYPATSKNPQGKLRALFEVFPFALIFENANGLAYTLNLQGERGALLHLKINDIHDRIPCYFGSREEVEFVTNFRQ